MKIGHDTLAQLQQKRIAYEKRVKAVQQTKAARHVTRIAEGEQWTAEDLEMVLDMLGINNDAEHVRLLPATHWM